MDLKSIGLCPQGFESPRCRFSALSATSCSLLPQAAMMNGKHVLIQTSQQEAGDACVHKLQLLT